MSVFFFPPPSSSSFFDLHFLPSLFHQLSTKKKLTLPPRNHHPTTKTPGQKGHREGQHRRRQDLRPERHPEEDRGPQLPAPRVAPRRRRLAPRDAGQDAGRRPLDGGHREGPGQGSRDQQHREGRGDDGRLREAVRGPRRAEPGDGGRDERAGVAGDTRGGRGDAAAAGGGRARAGGAAEPAAGRGAGKLSFVVLELLLGLGGEGGEGGLFFFCLVVVFFVSFFFSDPLSSPSLKKTKNKKQKKTQVAAPPQAAPQSAEPDLSERLAQLRGGAAK